MPADIKQMVTVICDNEDCKQSLFWVENKPEEIPDNVFRLLILQYFNQQKLIFCSKHCLLQFLNSKFVPLKSPREQAAEQAATQAAPTAPTVATVPESVPATEQAVLATPEGTLPEPKVVPFPAEVVGQDSAEAPVVAKKRGRPRKAVVPVPQIDISAPTTEA